MYICQRKQTSVELPSKQLIQTTTSLIYELNASHTLKHIKVLEHW